MKRERKRYDGTLKAKVAVEAIKGQRTINEIASAYGIHPHQVTQWKKQALEQLPEIFSNGRARSQTGGRGAARPALSGNRPVESGTRLAQKKIWFAPLRTVAEWIDSANSRSQHSAAMRAGRPGALELLLPCGRRSRGKPSVDASAGRAVHAHAVLRDPANDGMASSQRARGQSQACGAPDAADGLGGHLSEAASEPGRTGAQDLSVPPPVGWRSDDRTRFGARTSLTSVSGTGLCFWWRSWTGSAATFLLGKCR